MNLDYLFMENESYEIGDEVMPGFTVRRVLRCIGCVVEEKFLDSVYCTEKRYWIEENQNLVIPHCSLFVIPDEERNYLECDESRCGSCGKECVKNEDS